MISLCCVKMRHVKKKLLLFLGVLFIAFYCEYLIYYIVAAQCSWPSIENAESKTPLKAFILSDTHLLGPRKGHWLDKWRREWQMHQAYMAILTIHKPDVIFVLGDLFDEGEWSNSRQFKGYVDRFHELFPIPDDSDTVMHVVAGNHDIGFHKFIRNDNFKRFVKSFNSSIVELISLKDNHFVLVNSMAMEGDRCNMCVQARNDINKIAEILTCAENPMYCDKSIKTINYSRPILMQLSKKHFPMYRLSDAVCSGHDAPPLPERDKLFRPKWESLSLEATNFLANKIKPRAVFGGHTHHGCLLHHTYTDPEAFEFYEYSVPSFSWRNRHNPKYMLVSITPKNYSVSKCALPQETTIVICAVLMLFVVILQTKGRRRSI